MTREVRIQVKAFGGEIDPVAVDTCAMVNVLRQGIDLAAEQPIHNDIKTECASTEATAHGLARASSG